MTLCYVSSKTSLLQFITRNTNTVSIICICAVHGSFVQTTWRQDFSVVIYQCLWSDSLPTVLQELAQKLHVLFCVSHYWITQTQCCMINSFLPCLTLVIASNYYKCTGLRSYTNGRMLNQMGVFIQCNFWKLIFQHLFTGLFHMKSLHSSEWTAITPCNLKYITWKPFKFTAEFRMNLHQKIPNVPTHEIIWMSKKLTINWYQKWGPS